MNATQNRCSFFTKWNLTRQKWKLTYRRSNGDTFDKIVWESRKLNADNVMHKHMKRFKPSLLEYVGIE